MSKSYRRPGTDDKYRDDREFRRKRKSDETKSQQKRTAAALKKRDATVFYDDEELEDLRTEREETWDEYEEE